MERETQERAFAQGFREGRDSGLLQGMADAQQRMAQAVEAARMASEEMANACRRAEAVEHAGRLADVDRLLADLRAAADARMAALEADAVALAYAAVCKIVGDAAARGAGVSAIIQAGIHQLRGGGLWRVRLSAQSLALLQASEEGRALQARHPGVEWLVDASLVSGGCSLDMGQGSLDASLQTQLDRLRDAWVEVSRGLAGAHEEAARCPA
jgi:flagellar assembly protein FliH